MNTGELRGGGKCRKQTQEGRKRIWMEEMEKKKNILHRISMDLSLVYINEKCGRCRFSD
jgi:hypothetical protein